MNITQTEAWLRTSERLVRGPEAKRALARVRRSWSVAEDLTAGIAVAAAFVASRAPEVAVDLTAFHERQLQKCRWDAVERAWAIYAKEAATKRPAHRPRGSRPFDRSDWPALVYARMLQHCDNPPRVSEAIKRAVAVCQDAGVPVPSRHCTEASRDHRLRAKLKAYQAELDAHLVRIGYLDVEKKPASAVLTSPQ